MAEDLDYSWGVSGPLPYGLRSAASLERLSVFATQTCAPVAWRHWLATPDEFTGRLCGSGSDVTIDVAVLYTPAARAAAGGTAEVEAVIDLMMAETNQAYEASGVQQRVVLVERSEVAYNETGDSELDLGRLADPSDGHMDQIHAVRDRVGADLVHLIVDADKADVGGIAAGIPGVFGLTGHSGGVIFAHELGHNMGLFHDRYVLQEVGEESGRPHPAHGYVNQGAFEAGAPRSKGWRTIMAYEYQCWVVIDTGCSRLLRFSNSRQSYNGDRLGVPYGEGIGPDRRGGCGGRLERHGSRGGAVAGWAVRCQSAAGRRGRAAEPNFGA